MNELFANNATTTLGSAAGSGATTMTVATGTGNQFPSPAAGQYFSATLWAAGSTTGEPNEIVHVTSRTGDTMTVERGQEGTTAQAWSVGDTFANYPTAAFYNRVSNLGIQSSGEIQLTTSQTLSADQAGHNLLINGAGITLTFPSGIVETFCLNNIGSDIVSLSFPSGSDFKATLSPGERVILASNGLTPSFWRVVASGNVAVAPTGAAGGDLSGNYPNPSIAPGLVGQVITQQASTTPGAYSFSIPSNALPWAFAYLTGAGGGGGGSTLSRGAGGGGAGATCLGPIEVTPGGTVTGSLGTPGAGGSSGADGSNGGNSTMTNGTVTWTAGGGQGGKVVASAAGGTGGTTVTGAPFGSGGGNGLDGHAASNDSPWAGGGGSFWGGGPGAGLSGAPSPSSVGVGGGTAYGAAAAGGNGGQPLVMLIIWTHA